MSHLTALAAESPAPVAGPECRRATRHTCEITAEYYVLNEVPARPRAGCLVNLSTTGMALIVGHPQRPPTRLGVEVHSPDRLFSYLLVGQVVHTLPYHDAWLLGCAFDRPLSNDELDNLL